MPGTKSPVRKSVSLRALRGERVHGDVQGTRARAFEEVYRLVKRISRGRVMTYGQVATLIENRLSPRAVGWAMHGCPEGVPWHRVVNASGGMSTERIPDIPPGLQRTLLEAERIRFRENGTIDLGRYRWTPSEHRPATPKRAPRTRAPARRGRVTRR